MNILFVITGLALGGAERQVCDLADTLSKRGNKVTIAYFLQPCIAKPKLSVIDIIWLGGSKSPLAMLKATSNLVSLIARLKPAIVHSHMYHANILTRIASLFARIPRLVCTAHSKNEGGVLRMLAYRATNSLGNVFTNVSQEAVEAFEKKHAADPNYMVAMRNGIDIDKFKFSINDRINLRNNLGLQSKVVFIAVGRFHEAKDYLNLLAGFKKLFVQGSKCHLLIVGDGELRADIEHDIAAKSLTKDVTLLGIRHDITALLSASDVFVLASAWEGFGLVVAEAMACERRVVATNCGGVAEVLGQAGFLVPPKDSDALAEAMQHALLMSEAEAQAIGVKARERVVEHFNLEKVVDRWLEIYS